MKEAQIIINSCIWGSYIVLPMKNVKSELNSWTIQITGPDVIIGCVPWITNTEVTYGIWLMLAVLIPGTQTTTIDRDSNGKNGLEKTTNVFHCYFKSNSTQRGQRKRMIKICAESAWSNIPNRRHSDQAWIILKKASDLEILEQWEQVNMEDIWTRSTYPNQTQNSEKQKQPHQIETKNTEN